MFFGLIYSGILLVPTSIKPLNASSQNHSSLKGQSRSWKIFVSKELHPTTSPGIKSSILSDSFTPAVSFLLQIKMTSGKPRERQFSAIITASSHSSRAECFRITESTYVRRGLIFSPLREVLQTPRNFNSSPK
ncbi:hypothetical protein AVEN_93996-1 [Araneus ventricosus]|uniref:Uncharacterized protein n=1 Tax=Araneus ventricosus TaxID=182803 RepID=A0A4Y2CJQ3_ARAVE|nr:hypothetical protein AVEN_93996-1 [Araneus ventricosus]